MNYETVKSNVFLSSGFCG